MASQTYHVSQNRLCGSVSDTSIDGLLRSCAKHLITGTLTVNGPSGTGTIVLRAGVADHTVYNDLAGENALVALRALADGGYELAQRLPKLGGAIGSAAEFHGDISQNSIIEIMNHCERQALSCTVTIMSAFDRAEIRYRAGDIAQVLFNGAEDDDSVVEVVNWREGKFRVSVPPLPLDICGWPSAGREPTAPFKISDIARTLPPPKTRRGATLPWGKKTNARRRGSVAQGTASPRLARGTAPQPYLRASLVPPKTRAPAVPIARTPSPASVDAPPTAWQSLTLRAETVGEAPMVRTPELKLLLTAAALIALWTAFLLTVGGL